MAAIKKTQAGTTVRIEDAEDAYITQLATKLGITKTGVISLVLWHFQRSEIPSVVAEYFNNRLTESTQEVVQAEA